jgi:hypothetical protein
MVEILKNIIIPIAEVTFIVGVSGIIIYAIIKGIRSWWSRSFRLFLKYTIFRTKISEGDIEWCVEAIEKGWDYWDVKKYLMIKRVIPARMYDTLFIFNKVQKEFYKGGLLENGRIKGSNSKTQSSTKLPEFS